MNQNVVNAFRYIYLDSIQNNGRVVIATKIENDKLFVGASFFSPFEQVPFTKITARTIAVERMNMCPVVISIDNIKINHQNIRGLALAAVNGHKSTPEWARDIIYINT